MRRIGNVFDGFLSRYNFTDFHELNLDWLIVKMIELNETVENFVSLNTIKYADPIQWNIATQYEANTVVVDPATGTAYLSTQPVPSGVAISNTDYWTVIFDLDIAQANNNITLRDDGNNVLSTFTSDVGDWLLWNGILYRVTQTIGLSQAYVPGYNIERYTVELFVKDYIQLLADTIGELDDLNTIDKTSIVNAINELADNIGDMSTLETTDTSSLVSAINEIHESVFGAVSYVTPEQFGAVGDGIADDTQAFINAIAENKPLLACNKYKLSSTINVASTNATGKKLVINEVSSTASPAFMLSNENIDFDIQHLSCPGGVAIQLGDGVTNGLAVSTIRFGYIFASVGIKSFPGSVQNVQDDNINGGVIVYTTNGMVIDGTNRWTGEITINDVWFRTYDGTGGFAITTDCSVHGLTGLVLKGVSFEGANGGIEALNTNAGGSQTELSSIKAFGLRVSEMNLNNFYPVIKQTGNGRLFGEIYVDAMNASGIDIAQQSVMATRQSPLAFYGRIIKGSRTAEKAILVNGKLAIDVNDSLCSIGISGSFDDNSIPNQLSRCTGNVELSLKDAFSGKLEFLLESAGITLKLNSTTITSTSSSDYVSVESFYIPNVGLRYLLRHETASTTTNYLIVPAT